MPEIGTAEIYKVRCDLSGVDDARRFAELSVSDCDAAAREATAMVVTELAENIVKYGVRGADPFAGTIAITRDGNVIRVRATNQVPSPGDADYVMAAIARINESDSAIDLYRSRLSELLDNEGLARTQLGLLRAALEGGFRLSCTYDPPDLVIVAERRSETE